MFPFDLCDKEETLPQEGQYSKDKSPSHNHESSTKLGDVQRLIDSHFGVRHNSWSIQSVLV